MGLGGVLGAFYKASDGRPVAVGLPLPQALYAWRVNRPERPAKRAKTRASDCEPLLPSSADGNRKLPAISDRHKAEPKAEKRAKRHSR